MARKHKFRLETKEQTIRRLAVMDTIRDLIPGTHIIDFLISRNKIKEIDPFGDTEINSGAVPKGFAQ